MTVPSETNRSGPYNGNGVTTVFNYGFRIVDEDHLRVILTSVAGVETVLVVDADYIVSDVGEPAGGQIALMVAPATGETITILRSVPLTQETDLENQGAYYAETVEDRFDLTVMQIQQVAEEVNRAVRVPAATDPGTDLQLPAPEAGGLIAWNNTATGLENITPAELVSVVAYGTANADIFTGDGVQTVFSLSASPGVLNNLDVAVGGVTQLPGVDYMWVSGTTLTFTVAPANGVMILARYMQALAQGSADINAIIGLGDADAASKIGTSGGQTVEQRLNWLPRVDIPMNGGDVNFVTSDTYGNTNDGASGGTWYYGRNLSGVITGGPAPRDRGYGGAILHIDVRYDSADIGTDFVRGVMGRIVMTGATKGGRLGVHGEVIQNVASHASNANRNYVGTSGNCHTYTGDGGTDTGAGAKGAYFGGGFVTFLHAGAVNVLDGVGVEIDTVFSPTASVRYASAVTLGNAQRVRGVDVDCGLRFSGYTDTFGPGIGWRHLICNTDANSADPTYSGSTLWGTSWITNPATPRPVTHGIDWRGHTFSGSVIQAQYLDIQDGLWKSSFPQGIIELTNTTRVFQIQPKTTGDYLGILAGGVGDIIRFHANGRHVLPQGLVNAANDAAAAAAGIELHGLYSNGTAVQIRKV